MTMKEESMTTPPDTTSTRTHACSYSILCITLCTMHNDAYTQAKKMRPKQPQHPSSSDRKFTRGIQLLRQTQKHPARWECLNGTCHRSPVALFFDEYKVTKKNFN